MCFYQFMTTVEVHGADTYTSVSGVSYKDKSLVSLLHSFMWAAAATCQNAAMKQPPSLSARSWIFIKSKQRSNSAVLLNFTAVTARLNTHGLYIFSYLPLSSFHPSLPLCWHLFFTFSSVFFSHSLSSSKHTALFFSRFDLCSAAMCVCVHIAVCTLAAWALMNKQLNLEAEVCVHVRLQCHSGWARCATSTMCERTRKK